MPTWLSDWVLVDKLRKANWLRRWTQEPNTSCTQRTWFKAERRVPVGSFKEYCLLARRFFRRVNELCHSYWKQQLCSQFNVSKNMHSHCSRVPLKNSHIVDDFFLTISKRNITTEDWYASMKSDVTRRNEKRRYEEEMLNSSQPGRRSTLPAREHYAWRILLHHN